MQPATALPDDGDAVRVDVPVCRHRRGDIVSLCKCPMNGELGVGVALAAGPMASPAAPTVAGRCRRTVTTTG